MIETYAIKETLGRCIDADRELLAEQRYRINPVLCLFLQMARILGRAGTPMLWVRQRYTKVGKRSTKQEGKIDLEEIPGSPRPPNRACHCGSNMHLVHHTAFESTIHTNAVTWSTARKLSLTLKRKITLSVDHDAYYLVSRFANWRSRINHWTLWSER